MTAPAPATGPGLARITVATPHRRIDVAVPEAVPVAELLPHLLRHAGGTAPAGAGVPDLADAGQAHGGWVLRSTTGTPLEPARGLAAQGVRDGAVLHLRPARESWPEPGYDDLVEVIAGGARRAGRSWRRTATRRTGLAVAGVAFAAGVPLVLLAGPSWTVTGAVALLVALLLAAAGILAARAAGDGTAGALIAGYGLPYALLGGFLLALPPAGATAAATAGHGTTVPLPAGGGPGALLLGALALALVSVAGQLGVAALTRVFTAGLFTAVAGILVAVLWYAGASLPAAAAVTVTVAIGGLPGYPLLATWLGRLPMPALPERSADILDDRPPPPRSEVFAAVGRAYESLTGMLAGTALVSVAAVAVLLDSGRTPAVVLAVLACVALLLRARLFPAVPQRVPLLAGGVAGLALLAGAAGVSAGGGTPAGTRLLPALAVLVAAALVLLAGLTYGRRTPSPYLGRMADIADAAAIMALVPVACAVLGLYGAIASMFGSLGG